MSEIQRILDRVLDGGSRLTIDEAALLFDTTDKADLNAIKEAADAIRRKSCGNTVSYVNNLNVNFTNICESVCLFCGFRRSEGHIDAYTLNLDDFEEVLASASKDGISEICLQGGLYSKLQIKGLKSVTLLDMYAELLQWVKDKNSNIHIHAYSPEEIDFLSITSGKDTKYILEYLKDSGLDSMPGTAAEILVDDIRKTICPKKLNTKRWSEVVALAHSLKIPTTSTIMYGHIETSKHRAEHLGVLRNIQDKTGGFTEFVPLPFVARKTLLSTKITPLTSIDRLKLLAISRIFFKDSIKNIQASWVKQGMEETAESLDWGVNDVGGTLHDERITYEAGGSFGRGVSSEELIDLIKSKGREPMLRDTGYNCIEKASL